MDSVRSLPGVIGGARVQERNAGGSKASADAFRRALQQEGTASSEDADQSMRTRLQPRPVIGRKTDGAIAQHVDVLA